MRSHMREYIREVDHSYVKHIRHRHLHQSQFNIGRDHIIFPSWLPHNIHHICHFSCEYFSLKSTLFHHEDRLETNELHELNFKRKQKTDSFCFQR